MEDLGNVGAQWMFLGHCSAFKGCKVSIDIVTPWRPSSSRSRKARCFTFNGFERVFSRYGSQNNTIYIHAYIHTSNRETSRRISRELVQQLLLCFDFT